MRRVLTATTAVAAVTATLISPPAQAGPGTPGEREFLVLYGAGVPLDRARAAVTAAGGAVTAENTAIGFATVLTSSTRFVGDVIASQDLAGAAPNRPVAALPKEGRSGDAAESVRAPEPTATGSSGPVKPVAERQWDMKQINAPEAHALTKGDKGVLVGVMDTGIDASHPDIAPNFDRALSRNFTVDMPRDANGVTIDGECATDPDGSCHDPADVDENEHGTHIASTIAAPDDGVGITGVAPNVTIVNLRTGQDSGQFFLKPTLDALVYAADNGIDVVNMSYYLDPWAWNCPDDPTATPEERLQQKTVIEAVNRALRYAHGKGVTLIAAAGNDKSDYTRAIIDNASPNFASIPGQKPRKRRVPPSCVSQPSEGEHVIPVSATGITGRKAYYSSYGLGYVAVAAPGGDKVDTPDGRVDDEIGVWAAYPEQVGRAGGTIRADGTPAVPYVVKEGGAYYASLQGTSMAAPHAAGVAALIVSRYGQADPVHGGLTLDPVEVRKRLVATSVPTACPVPATYTYRWNLGEAEHTSTQTCEGTLSDNGFFGAGVINARDAVE
ncbi:S8 family serine peptidase [Actinocorallia sp. API 0066]|uniref:S8 family peptidase n=1 Tax=Actinocorallia sp. API 0066 TaxID=2896846 RepID=UPI001E34B850|nr:S8 family serine peptidase [Actinocorallia sp. API 0066]MCD0450452.1 S8 family serine peptidase [Actinocorallia sp. API 0066]